MAVETAIHDLSAGPINLRDVIGGGVLVMVQNIGETRIYFAELEVEPATTDDGLILDPGAVVQVSIDVIVEPPPLLGSWVWARAAGRAATTRAYAGL